VVVHADRTTAVEFPLVRDGTAHPGRAGGGEIGQAAFAQVLEIALPFAALGLAPRMKLALSVYALRGDVEVERLPRYGFVSVTVPDADFDQVNWRV
jgi:hypothetical protein